MIELVILILCVYNAMAKRELYDLYDDGLVRDRVKTYAAITDPVGIVSGHYNGHRGLFVSSFVTHSIYFVSSEHEAHESPDTIENALRISGGSDSIDMDGSFRYASFAEPSRMAYDEHCKMLFVGTRRSMRIRVMRMDHGDVKTCSSEGGEDLSLGSPPQFTEFPGMDVQSDEGRAVYVTNSQQLFKVSTADEHHFCEDIVDKAVVTEYTSLTKYMLMNNYGDRARVYSVAPDSSRGCLYVVISDEKNVILKIPMESVQGKDYTNIVKLVGDESKTWSGDTSQQNPPISVDGYAQSDTDVKLAFPMHLQFDDEHSLLYWSECFPFAGSFLLGSLAIRRMNLINGSYLSSTSHKFYISVSNFLICCRKS